jgi:hypothetical protein
MAFPNSEHGWEQRKPVRGLDPIHLRQVPVGLAASTGLTPPAERPVFHKAA